jgi:hypothetical protein
MDDRLSIRSAALHGKQLTYYHMDKLNKASNVDGMRRDRTLTFRKRQSKYYEVCF